MGSTVFQEQVPVSEEQDFGLAFSSACLKAARTYRADSYSGTINEKAGALAFPRGFTNLQHETLSVETVIGALAGSDVEAKTDFLRVWPRLARELERAQDLYDDKWAPAVGFRFGEHWYFVGLASS